MDRRQALQMTSAAALAATFDGTAIGAGAPNSIGAGAEFLSKAEALKPTLVETLQRPRGLVQPVPDASRPLGWAIVPAGSHQDLEFRVLKKGDSLIIDFGGHRTGYLSFDLVGVGRNVDAPARLRLVFGEVVSDVAEPLHPYTGTLSQAWLPEEIVTIDHLPQSVRLPRRYSFRFVKVEVIDTSSSFGVSFRKVTARAVTSARSAPAALPAHWPSDLKDIDRVAAATLRDCMQTVFEDGPRRDQRLWTGDLRLQALTSYASMPNHDLVKRCLYLLAAFPRDDGLLPGDVFELPQPSAAADYAYDYAALYPVTLADYVEATGDRATGLELWPSALRQLFLLNGLIDGRGVFVIPSGVWVFVDWHDTLDRTAAMQGIYIYAMKRVLALGRALGRSSEVASFPERIAVLEQAALTHLYDQAKQVFVSGRFRQISTASQAWLTIAGVGSKKLQATALRRALGDRAAIQPRTPYLNHYVVEALFRTGCNREAIALLRAYWGGMLKAGADTFWEAYSPESPRVAPYGDFHVNSFCHAWSCTPSYLLRVFAREVESTLPPAKA